MFYIEQSVFLQALGRSIGHSLWQMAALWLAYAAVSNIGKLNARRKYQLAAGTSLLGVAWFTGTLVYMVLTTPERPVVVGIYAETAAEAGSSFPEYLLYLYHSTALSLSSLAPYISCAYLLLFAMLGIRLANGFRQVKQYATQHLEKVQVDLRLFVQHHAAALQIPRKVQVFASPYVPGVLTLGFWKPIILLPVACLNQLSVTEVESILLHELAHIRRHDYLVNIFLQVAEVCLFFNPFMRLLLKQAKQERENNCDDYVIQFGYQPKDYIKALLAIEQHQNRALLALSAKGDESYQLLNRVKRMVAPQPRAFNYRQQLGLLVLFTILTLGFTVIIPHPRKAAQKQAAVVVAKAIANTGKSRPEQMESILIEPISANAYPGEEPDTKPPAFDLVRTITDQGLALQTGEKLAEDRELELSAAELDALGKEVEVALDPKIREIESWAHGLEQVDETGFTAQQLVVLDQLAVGKEIDLKNVAAIGEVYQKRIKEKVANLINAIPFVHSKKLVAAVDNQHERAAINTESLAEREAAYQAAYQATYLRGQAQSADWNRVKIAASMQRQIQIQNQLRQADEAALQRLVGLKAQENARLQLEKTLQATRLSEALKKAEKLHVGLFTDDRDSTINGLLAKFQRQKDPFHNLKVSFSITDPELKNNHKPVNGRCVITISDDGVKISAEGQEQQAPKRFQIQSNNQGIDVHRERQMNNGKEEEVTVISISAS